jgi:UDP-N-acetylmuramoyl-L-alanyl-D-glutamate--2,6-diaminopimelate ligase
LTDHLAKIERLRERRKEDVPKFLISKFNEENIAVAMAIAKELGIPPNIAEDAVANFEGVPGRMEFVSHGPYLGIVDYAHTPDSLEAAYSAARALFPDESGRLICVMGAAGGGRDTWKRPEFGKIAAHYCDEVILTDEDSYDEKPEAILDEIAEGFTGMPYPRPEVFRILNRREALQKAVELMKEGDIVIATGKGSEEWIHLAHGKKVPWNEKEVLEELLMMKR